MTSAGPTPTWSPNSTAPSSATSASAFPPRWPPTPTSARSAVSPSTARPAATAWGGHWSGAAVEEARQGGFRRITLRVLGHNTAARKLYESEGFVVEGVQPEEFHLDGQYVDDVLMGQMLTGPGAAAEGALTT
ncbi:hypothetical protein RKD37_006431 [Streptomyces ambofaciens]